MGTTRIGIMKSLDMGWPAVAAKAIELNLGPPPARRNGRTDHARAVGDLHHRASLKFRSPIELKPCGSLFGAPIRVINSATQALIDAALAERASA